MFYKPILHTICVTLYDDNGEKENNKKMEVTKMTPNITVYSLTPNKNEDMYCRCMWAKVTLDHDSYALSVISDCGNYTYKWGKREHEPFLSLLSRLDKDYLLGKIADRTKFNLEESKKATLNNLEYYKDEKEYDEAVEFITELDDVGEEGFYTRIDGMFRWIDFESIEIVKDYPAGAITFCDLFIDYLQPQLKEELKHCN